MSRVDADALSVGEHVQDMRDSGLSWSTIAVETGYNIGLAQRFAQRYVETVEAEQRKHQLELF